jgi:hypothetical protein
MRPKLCPACARQIRTRFAAGEPGKLLAHEYGVTKATISMIVHQRIWRENDDYPRDRSRYFGCTSVLSG